MAISDISLTAGMRNNLLALQSTSAALTQTQDRLSSGKKVNSALDNPTNFFSAQSHLQRSSDLADRKDGMSEGVQTIKAANAGITSITSLIQAAKGLASSALGTTDAASRKSYQDQFNSLRDQIDKLATDSNYKGTNLLKADSITLQFSQKTGDATLVVNGFNAATTGTNSLNILAPGATNTNSTTAATAAGAALTAASSELTAIKAGFAAGNAALSAFAAADTAVQSTTLSASDFAAAQAAAYKAAAALTTAGAALATGVATNGAGATAQTTYMDPAAAALTAAGDALGLRAAGGGVVAGDHAAIGTAVTNLSTFNVVTTGGTSVVHDATAAAATALTDAAAATTVGDTNVAAALTASGTDLTSAANALTNISTVALSAYTGAQGTALSNAALAATNASTSVVGSAAEWGDASSTVGAAAITASSKALDGAMTTLRNQSSALASNLSVITTRQDFTANMINTLTQGADNLTLADMNQEGANMLMLQTRQSLSTTALSLSSQAAQSILKLF